MSEIIKMVAEPRTLTGKKVKQLRVQDIIPAVIYGQKVDGAVTIQIERDVLRQTLRAAGGTSVVEIKVGSNAYNVVVREVQRDILTGEAQHVDFYAVALDVKITSEVPISFVGEPEIVASGEAMLITPVNMVEVEALPTDIPSELELDLTKITEIGDFLTVADLNVPAGAEVITDADLVLVRSDYATALETEEEEEEEAVEMEAGEVEVIRKGREEDEEDEE